jgi:hypothetical protein
MLYAHTCACEPAPRMINKKAGDESACRLLQRLSAGAALPRRRGAYQRDGPVSDTDVGKVLDIIFLSMNSLAVSMRSLF